MTLAEALARNESDKWSRAIGDVVVKGMEPFNGGRVILTLDDDLGFSNRTRTLWIEVEAVRNYPFRYKFDEYAILQSYLDPGEYIYLSIRDDLVRHFRYRPTLPVDDHVELGEN